MNTKQQAANEIRRFANSMKGLIALGEELDEINSLENAAKEAELRLHSARSEEDAARDRLAGVQAEVKTAMERSSQILADARRIADETVNIGKLAAADHIAKAKNQAESDHSIARANLASIEANGRKAAAHLEDLDRKISEKSAIVADLDKKIEAIRAKIS